MGNCCRKRDKIIEECLDVYAFNNVYQRLILDHKKKKLNYRDNMFNLSKKYNYEKFPDNFSLYDNTILQVNAFIKTQKIIEKHKYVKIPELMVSKIFKIYCDMLVIERHEQYLRERNVILDQ